MSWGYRITVLILGFVCFMTFLVVSAFRQNFDLVAEDYYGKELAFQSQIEKQKNQQEMKSPISWEISDDTLVIAFPAEVAGKTLTGEVFFFRPSDAKKDRTVALAADTNGIQKISAAILSKGMYRLQIDYAAGGKKYYSEQNIMIP